MIFRRLLILFCCLVVNRLTAQIGDTVWFQPNIISTVHDIKISKGCRIFKNDSIYTELLYYDNNRIWIRSEYLSDSKLGFEKRDLCGYKFSYDPEGKIEYISDWRDGEELSSVHFDEYGRIRAILQKIVGNDIYDSKFTEFYLNGNPKFVEFQLHGEVVRQELFCENGQQISGYRVQSHMDQKNWEPDTNYVEYYCNGKTKLRYQFAYYNLHAGFGKCIEWYESGVISRRFEFDSFWDNNKKEYGRARIGIWKYYDEKGKIYKVQKYCRNQLKKERVYFKCDKCEQYYQESSSINSH
jgi:antitoxin component YwqK of YwqJK toxin-antitoxin module